MSALAAGTAGVSTSCPKEQPALGQSCDYTSGICIYSSDKCFSQSFECREHQWRLAPSSDGAAYDCNSFSPTHAPKDGDACDCLGLLDCTYPDCRERGLIHAVCDNTSWSVKELPCAARVCGPDGLYCQVDQLCVVRAGIRAPEFSCETNRCGFAPTSCRCAGTLCDESEICGIDSGVVVCSAKSLK